MISSEILRIQAISKNTIFLIDQNSNIRQSKRNYREFDLAVGDYVEIDLFGVITKVINRKNLLSRSYQGKTKRLSANLEHLFIVTAVKPTFNIAVLDRAISSCVYEGISFSIIVNKSDLNCSELDEYLACYKSLEIDIHTTCTKRDSGSDNLIKYIDERRFQTIAFFGVSGVGKSSLLNQILKNERQKTGLLSNKSGQGKQTTSMASLHRTTLSNGSIIDVIDLPGLQHFGVCNIPLSDISYTFLDFKPLIANCFFRDCSHISEPNCGILTALMQNKLFKFRYESYLDMRKEIESNEPSY